MTTALIRTGASVVSLVLLLACEAEPPTSTRTQSSIRAEILAAARGRHIVLFRGERVPADFRERVATLGGTLEAAHVEIGVATVSGLTDVAANQLAAAAEIQAVERDVVMTRSDDLAEAVDAFAAPALTELLTSTGATTPPTFAQFYPRQWNMRAIFAHEAWAAGHVGSRNVVVAILDSGIDYTLPDFDGLVDLARSRSFTPDEDPVVAERFPGRLPISDLHSHGTAMASVIASNGLVLAGINRNVTLLAVKIWNRLDQGSVAQFLAGLMYAADQGADVINMSGWTTFDKSREPGVVAAINRAANYAYRKGGIVVSISGNDGADLDHNGDLAVLPCEAPHVICASATGPASTAGPTGPWVDADAFASYSNFGRSAVDVAAPGGAGDFANPDPVVSGTQFRRIWTLCTTTPTELSFAACRRRLAIAQPFGTSLAAAHVSGLAALLVAQLGHGKTAQIRARILQSADDLGEPGTDPYYGTGRINVARAVGVPR